MSDPARWSRVTDIVGTGAVVVSLLYVGLQVRQNTAAIQTSTSQEVYQQNQEQGLLVMESAEFAEILLEASRDLATLSPIDSIRYHHYLNVSLNTYEAVYTNALQGTMESDMAAGWLDGLGGLRCKAGMAAYGIGNERRTTERFERRWTVLGRSRNVRSRPTRGLSLLADRLSNKELLLSA